MIRLQSKKFNSLEEFYTEIRNTHEEAHGKEYTAQHDVIKDKVNECESYRELGVMQGATAACAALAGYKSLHLIDIDLKPFRAFEKLFNGINYKADQKSSIKFKSEELDSVDLLLIDSLHLKGHLSKELDLHAPRVNKYILFHDTFAKQELQEVIDKFIKNNTTSWELEEYYQKNVGYTLIKRIGNAG